jgi:hypothetical protein
MWLWLAGWAAGRKLRGWQLPANARLLSLNVLFSVTPDGVPTFAPVPQIYSEISEEPVAAASLGQVRGALTAASPGHHSHPACHLFPPTLPPTHTHTHAAQQINSPPNATKQGVPANQLGSTCERHLKITATASTPANHQPPVAQPTRSAAPLPHKPMLGFMTPDRCTAPCCVRPGSAWPSRSSGRA